MFLDSLFAEHAGTRTQAIINSPYWRHVDACLGGLLSDSCQSKAPPSPDERMGGEGDRADPDDADDVDDTVDPSDEVYQGHPDGITPMEFGLFWDGVQLNGSASAATAVFSLKCICLPAFLVNTLRASYNVAFISGGVSKNEVKTLTSFVTELIQPFINWCPTIERRGDDQGAITAQPHRCACLLSKQIHFVSLHPCDSDHPLTTIGLCACSSFRQVL